MKKAVVYGAGGFIGHHMVKRLKDEGYRVCGVDLKYPEFEKTKADMFYRMDLRDYSAHEEILGCEFFDEVYQYACMMGGAELIFTGDHDSQIMLSGLINLNLLRCLSTLNIKPKIFYSSSACVYPQHNQLEPDNPNCEESSAYPANPDSEYGWEKLFSERLYKSFERNHSIPVRIARYHNIYGPLGTWQGGKEKAPAAMCRKVAETANGGSISVWGDGKQTRSFLYIDDCIEATRRLMNMNGPFYPVVNIGSEEMVSINTLLNIVQVVADKVIIPQHIDGPLGVRGRNSHNKLVEELLDWEPKVSLKEGIKKTYEWIEQQVIKGRNG